MLLVALIMIFFVATMGSKTPLIEDGDFLTENVFLSKEDCDFTF